MGKMSDEEKKQRARDRAKTWRLANPDRYRQNQLRWRLANLDVKAASDHVRYERHKDKKAAYDKKYYQNNRTVKNQQALVWAAAHPSERASHKCKWVRNHPIEQRLYCRARRTKTVGVSIKKEDIVNWQSRICGICEKIIESDFHLDHIIPLSRGGPHSVHNLQLAHPFCNLSKNNREKIKSEPRDKHIKI